MKRLFLIILLLISIISHAQVNRYSKTKNTTYQPRTFEELSRVAQFKSNQYDSNQKYFYDLKKWILELRTVINGDEFIKRLDLQYSALTTIENGDLSIMTKILHQIENATREVISDYKIALKENQTKFNQSTSKNNTDENYLDIGIQNFENKNYYIAIRNFSKQLEIDKNNTDVIYFRALSKNKIKDSYGAIDDYEKIIELNSNYPMQYNNLATVYNNIAYSLVQLSKYKEALPFIEKALKMDRTQWVIWDTRGEINLYLGNYNQSISDLDNAINIKEHKNSYFLRGLANLKLGKKEKGCSDLSKARELGESKAYKEISENCN
tara:strand:+ start:501 stop:1469 length:969 start_codon:yes stop_codon:yes gene_type:complete